MNRILWTALIAIAVAFAGCTSPSAVQDTDDTTRDVTGSEPDDTTTGGDDVKDVVDDTTDKGDDTNVEDKTPDLTKNVHARHCVSLAIDRTEIADLVFGGTVDPALSMVPNGMEGHTPAWKKWSGGEDGLAADTAGAAQHCGFAGYDASNKLGLTLWYTPTHYGDTEADLATVLASQFEATGVIDVTVKSTEWQQYKTDFRSGNYNIFLLGWFPDYLDPDNYLSSFMTKGGGIAAGSFYHNTEMEELLLQQAAMAPGPARDAVLADVQELAADHLAYIPLFQGQLQAVAQDDVTGVVLAPHQVFTYYTLEKPGADTITVGTTDSITSLDYADAYEYMSNNILYNTGAGLTWYDGATTDIVPHLAESWEMSEDGMTYTFTIKDGLKFSDGSPITAENFLWALERNSGTIGAREGGPAWMIQTYVDVANSSAPDDRTLIVKLKSPASFFPSVVAFTNFYPLPTDTYTKDAFVEPTGPTENLPIASGPYKVTEYRAGESITLEANEHYTGPNAPVTDKIVIRFFSNSGALKSAVEAGQVDVGYRTFTPDEWTDLENKAANAGFTTYDTPAPSPLRYLVLNVGTAGSPFHTGLGY